MTWARNLSFFVFVLECLRRSIARNARCLLSALRRGQTAQEYVEASEAKALPMIEYRASLQEHAVEHGKGRHRYSPREVLYLDVAWCHLRIFQ
jgi:hypothetical protein